MNETKNLVRQNPHRQLPALEELVQAAESLLRHHAAGVHEFFRFRPTPLLPQGRGRGTRGRHILGMQAGVADHPDGATHSFQCLSGGFQD